MSALPPKADIGWRPPIRPRTVRFTIAGMTRSKCSFTMVFALVVVTTVRTKLFLNSSSLARECIEQCQTQGRRDAHDAMAGPAVMPPITRSLGGNGMSVLPFKAHILPYPNDVCFVLNPDFRLLFDRLLS